MLGMVHIHNISQTSTSLHYTYACVCIWGLCCSIITAAVLQRGTGCHSGSDCCMLLLRTNFATWCFYCKLTDSSLMLCTIHCFVSQTDITVRAKSQAQKDYQHMKVAVLVVDKQLSSSGEICEQLRCKGCHALCFLHNSKCSCAIHSHEHECSTLCCTLLVPL
jgi:hypothetical protein